jgi:hypothetical protein
MYNKFAILILLLIPLFCWWWLQGLSSSGGGMVGLIFITPIGWSFFIMWGLMMGFFIGKLRA